MIIIGRVGGGDLFSYFFSRNSMIIIINDSLIIVIIMPIRRQPRQSFVVENFLRLWLEGLGGEG